MRYNKINSLSGAHLRFLCYSAISASVLAVMSLFCYPQSLPTPTYADEPVDVTPTLSISPSSPLTLQVTPGNFNSVNQTITVSTSNYTGYTLNLATSGASTNLVHTGDSSITIPTITLPSGNDSITSAGFTSAGYGYSTNATNYVPVPAVSGTGDNIAVTSHENPGTGSHTLTFGAKSEVTTPSGTYQNSFTLTATANDATYSITYNANAGGDTVTNMPSANESTISGTTVTISTKTPVRNGYNFLGWAESSSATSATIQPSGTFTISPTGANVKTFYAVWQVARTMQTVGTWASTVSTGETVTAMDTRDNSIYTVARLADGRLWMTKNLRLDFSNLTNDISASNTNNPTSAFVTAAALHPTTTSAGFNGTTNEYNIEYSTVNLGDSTQDSNGDTYDDYGTYYNWFTATAGHGVESMTSGTAEGDLCPYGWRLPTGEGTASDFYALVRDVNSGSDSDPSGLLASPAEFVMSGRYVNTYITGRGASSHYWGSTLSSQYTGGEMISGLDVSTSIVSSADQIQRFIGGSIRCVAGKQYTLTYNSNGGVGTPSSQTAYDESGSHTFTLSSSTPTRTAYSFLGWSTNPTATTATYSASGSATFTDANVTLYAVWQANTNGRTMQNVTTWASSVTAGQTTTAIDTRDGEGYTVGRLADGNLWMTKNLRLDFSNLKENISLSNTSLSSTSSYTSSFITWANNSPAADNGTWCNTNTAACINEYRYDTSNIGNETVDANGNYYDDYGVYYDQYLIQGGAINGYSASICPYGWHIPSVHYPTQTAVAAPSSYYEFANLKTTLNSDSTISTWLAGPNNFVLGGYKTDSVQSRGEQFAYRGYTLGLNYDGTSITTANKSYTNGVTVRCVAGTSYYIAYYVGSVNSAPLKDYVNMPNRDSIYTETSPASLSYTISSQTPSRIGYTFLGWSDSATATSASYQPGDTITISNTGGSYYVKNLYAVWSANTNRTMQDVASWATASDIDQIGETAVAIDVRDNVGYTVARLNDGKLWMTRNLRLPFYNLNQAISSTNTNNPATGFNSTPVSSNTMCTTSDATCWDKIQYYAAKGTADATIDVGTFYNYFAATAGQGPSTFATTTTGERVSGDVCPYGWHLPTGNTAGEYATLNTAQNSGSTTSVSGLLASPANFTLSGYWWGSNSQLAETGLYYWTSTARVNGSGIPYAYYFGFNGSAVQTTYMQVRSTGSTIRCIAGQDYTLKYDANGGAGAPSTQTDYVETAHSKTFTIPSTSPTRTAYTFQGWATTPSASTATYQPGGTITLSFNENEVTLYAVWTAATSRTLQTVHSWANASDIDQAGETTVAIDTRNGEGYTVARLNDGRLWMTKNLNLSLDNLTESISASNTNNPASGFPATTASTSTFCNTNDETCWDSIQYNKDSASTYGVYYNYFTASAGQGGSSFATTNTTQIVPGDLCPYGWRLPTGYTAGEYATLNTAQNSGSTTSVSGLLASPANFVLGGYKVNTTSYYNGNGFGYWASTTYSNGSSRYANATVYTGATLYPGTTSLSRTVGGTVRCIAGQKYTVNYNANMGYMSPSSQSVYVETAHSYTFTLSSNIPTKRGYTFQGWATTSTASVPTYQPGATISMGFNSGNNITLYAVWTPSNNQSLQDVGFWGDSVTTGNTTTAIDNRDGKSYTVARLADGRLWMTKNLALDFAHLTSNITAANTNSPTSAFMTWANASPASNDGTWCMDSNDASCTDQFQYYSYYTRYNGADNMGTNYDDYGVYYNNYTFSAGNAGSTVTSTYSGDICPYGWRLPTGATTNSEANQLIKFYNNNSTTSVYSTMTSEPLYLRYTGYKSGQYLYNGGNADTKTGLFAINRNYQSSTTLYAYTAGIQTAASASYTWAKYGNIQFLYIGFNVRCIADERVFRVQYLGNTSNETVSNLPATQRSDFKTGTSYTFTIPSNIPTRNGYRFTGYHRYGDSTTMYQPGQTITVSTSDMSTTYNGAPEYYTYFYAQWTVDKYMQNVGTWGSSVTTGQTVYAVDNRDGKVYRVSRLADGNLWMTQDLRLSLGTASITAANTNNPSSAFITAAAQHPGYEYPEDWCNNNTTTCTDKILWNPGETNTGGLGEAPYEPSYYYNYYTATAGTWKAYTESANYGATGDICPYGWKMPLGYNSGQYYTLNQAINSGSTSSNSNWLNSPAYFDLNGYLGAGSSTISSVGTSGAYWTRSYSTSVASTLYLHTNGTIYPGTGTQSFYNGHAVRCVAKEYADLTINYDESTNAGPVENFGYPGGTGESWEDSFSGVADTYEIGEIIRIETSLWDDYNDDFGGFTVASGTPAYTYALGSQTNAKIVLKHSNVTLNLSVTPTTFASAFAAEGISKVNGYYPMNTGNTMWAVCGSTSVGQTTTLIDTRDNQLYKVGRFRGGEDSNYDNYCWMMENSRLGVVALTTNLTTSNSNVASTIPASTFNSWVRSSVSATTSTPQIYVGDANTTDSFGNKYGAVYNYVALSGNTVTGSSNTSGIINDICPAGWQVPMQADFSDLIQYNHWASPYNILRTEFGFPLAGYIYSGTSRNSGGSEARFWFSTYSGTNAQKMDHAIIRGNASALTGLTLEPGSRLMSLSMRCISGATDGGASG